MKYFSAKTAVILSPLIAVGIFLAVIADIHTLKAQDAPKEGAPPQGKGGGGKGKGGGPGAPAADTLGAGPWDFKTEAANIHVSVVSKGLDHPWALVFLPNGDMLVTERAGRLRVVRKGVLDPTPISGVPELRTGVLGGFMDVILHPNFAKNHWIYFSYAKPGPVDNPAHTSLAVGRARYDGGSALTDVKDIFVADGFGGEDAPKSCCGQGPSEASYGSRFLFDKTGALLFTSGDRNHGELAQDTSSNIGKILRIKDDGSIPSDNPFVGKQGYKPEIYTIGHRNPLGLTMDSATGRIWETEFGPNGGDELNLIQAGKNYGWIKVTKGEHYNKEPSEKSAPGVEEPVLYWVPVINPGNPLFYNGDKFPGWKGAMIMGDMTRSVLRATFDAQGKATGQERFMTELNQRFRDTRVGPDGFIYLLTDETAGAILRIEPGK